MNPDSISFASGSTLDSSGPNLLYGSPAERAMHGPWGASRSKQKYFPDVIRVPRPGFKIGKQRQGCPQLLSLDRRQRCTRDEQRPAVDESLLARRTRGTM